MTHGETRQRKAVAPNTSTLARGADLDALTDPAGAVAPHRAKPVAPARLIAPLSLPAIGRGFVLHNGYGPAVAAMPIEKDHSMPCTSRSSEHESVARSSSVALEEYIELCKRKLNAFHAPGLLP